MARSEESEGFNRARSDLWRSSSTSIARLLRSVRDGTLCPGEMCVNRGLIVIALVFVAALQALVPNPAEAQSGSVDLSTAAGPHSSFETKQRRLKIAGWTLVGTGLGAVVTTAIATPLKVRNTDSEDRSPVMAQYWATGAMVATVLAGTGGIILGRRRRLNRKREESISISVGLGRLSLRGRF